jgi:16S rRNA (guanine966-N2)-methyltransferase
MTRIIAGVAGSRAIAVPKSGTRPTSDRVREAIFSGLDARDVLQGATVLDLYAGSGALGLEAASRGATSVTLVERSAAAASVCRRNAAIVTQAFGRAEAPRIDVVTQAVTPFLTGLRAGAWWDVVFIDPPYELGEAELAENLAALVPSLSTEAVVMVERSTRSPEPEWPAGLEQERSRAYGETTLWWAAPAG